MKNLEARIVVGLILLYIFPFGLRAQHLSVVQVISTELKNDTMHLCSVVNGKLEKISSSYPVKGKYTFEFYPNKSAFYVFCQNTVSPIHRYVFYLKPGDNVQLQIERENWKLVGENTEENHLLESWHKLVWPLEKKSTYFMLGQSTYKDFFPELDSLLPDIKAFQPTKKENIDIKFLKSFNEYRKYNLADIALNFIYTPRIAFPSKGEDIPYYKNLHIKDYSQSSSILDYPGGLQLLERIYWNSLRMDSTLSHEKLSSKMSNGLNDLLNGKDSIQDLRVKGEMVLFYAQRCRTYPGIIDFKEKYGRYLFTDGQKKRMDKLVNKLMDHSVGQDAINFKFQDKNGKFIALSDFKGHAVYIDVWATWCVPCNREIPYLQSLEEQYKNDNRIVFIGVSVDSEKDKRKWKDFIVAKKMHGIQLFAGDNSNSILNPYKIKGIPRFIMVDQKGKLVTVDAPRPSSPEIIPLINATINKK
ncbi:MAG: TlpA family protein disulfide reductase [Prevotella sp.]|jgi:thiol-disulfide isomerase/thioredoxin|nr:TlpA disulfide reductase family protein [Prevotella sp.]MCH3995379.1 TlpA family protein disulfide reductase [Prevotella sp.]